MHARVAFRNFGDLCFGRGAFPSSQRRGGCAIRKMTRSHRSGADGVVRPARLRFRRTDHPGAPASIKLSRHPSSARRKTSPQFPNATPGNETPMRRIKNSITLSAFQIFAFLFWSTAGAAQPAASSTGRTNIFAPESTPAQWIFHFSMFVLAITGIIFVAVFTLLVYAVVKFRGRTAD